MIMWHEIYANPVQIQPMREVWNDSVLSKTKTKYHVRKHFRKRIYERRYSSVVVPYFLEAHKRAMTNGRDISAQSIVGNDGC